MMTARTTPLLFSTPMVRAMLEGRKTQTRRTIRGVEPTDLHMEDVRVDTYPRNGKPAASNLFAKFETPGQSGYKLIRYPNRPGDTIWARENFSPGTQILDDPKKTYWIFVDGAQMYSDGQYFEPSDSYEVGAFDGIRWRPSIHMPQTHARIWLECTGMRPERVQSISEADCKAEGIAFDTIAGRWVASELSDGATPEEAFRYLWYEVNDVASWVTNPWVWVRTFRILSTTGKPATI